MDHTVAYVTKGDPLFYLGRKKGGAGSGGRRGMNTYIVCVRKRRIGWYDTDSAGKTVHKTSIVITSFVSCGLSMKYCSSISPSERPRSTP